MRAHAFHFAALVGVLAIASDANGQVLKNLLHGPNASREPLTDITIREALAAWCDDPGSAIGVYGNISDWDTSGVTDMAYLFSAYSNNNGRKGYCSTYDKFNEDISKWSTSSVTTMRAMFNSAASFNRNLSSWDVSRVVDMRQMFEYASSFDGDISAWNVTRVNSMKQMFEYASSFNGDISAWDVSRVKHMGNMFVNAESFNGDVSAWDVSRVTTMEWMFGYAHMFSQHLCWSISPATYTNNIFHDTAGACIDKTCGGSVPGHDIGLYC